MASASARPFSPTRPRHLSPVTQMNMIQWARGRGRRTAGSEMLINAPLCTAAGFPPTNSPSTLRVVVGCSHSDISRSIPSPLAEPKGHA